MKYQINTIFFSALATTNGKSSSSGGGAKSKSNGQAANNNKQYDFTKSLRNDANLVPPIRQTASIFKQPVTVSSTTYNLNNTAAPSIISKSKLISYSWNIMKFMGLFCSCNPKSNFVVGS